MVPLPEWIESLNEGVRRIHIIRFVGGMMTSRGTLRKGNIMYSRQEHLSVTPTELKTRAVPETGLTNQYVLTFICEQKQGRHEHRAHNLVFRKNTLLHVIAVSLHVKENTRKALTKVIHTMNISKNAIS